MTRDEGVALIKQQLGFHTAQEATIIGYLQLAQTELENAATKPWFLMSEDSYTSTTVDDERVPIPSDFLSEVEEATFKYRPDDWPDEPEVDLVKDEYDVLRRNFACVEAGPPEAYAIMGKYFRVFPKPDAVYQMRLIYWKRDQGLSTNIENLWLRHQPLLLLGSAGLLTASALRDANATNVFSQWVATGNRTKVNATTEHEINNRTLQVGGPHQ